jgi:hypothetical protein
LVFGIGIQRSDGVMVLGTNTMLEQLPELNLKEQGEIRIVIERLGLLAGQYTLDLAVHAADGYPYDYHQSLIKFSVRDPLGRIGVVTPPLRWIVD